MDQIPPLLHAGRPPPINLENLARKSTNVDVIADLDSPSLSDTQIPPHRPVEPQGPGGVSLLDLDTFDLTQEEIELEQVMAEGYMDEDSMW